MEKYCKPYLLNERKGKKFLNHISAFMEQKVMPPIHMTEETSFIEITVWLRKLCLTSFEALPLHYKVHVGVYVGACRCTCRCMQVYMQVHVGVYVGACRFMQVCMQVHVGVHRFMQVCMQVHVGVHAGAWRAKIERRRKEKEGSSPATRTSPWQPNQNPPPCTFYHKADIHLYCHSKMKWCPSGPPLHHMCKTATQLKLNFTPILERIRDTRSLNLHLTSFVFYGYMPA